jgi:hypothetical protein
VSRWKVVLGLRLAVAGGTVFAFFYAVTYAAIAVVPMAVSACAARSQPVGPSDVALYTAEQMTCLERPTKEEIDVCRLAIKRSRCGPGGIWLDAGVCPEGGAP